MTGAGIRARLVDMLAVLLAVFLTGALGSLGAPGLVRQVMHRMPESGAAWPVTAVLLNFRGYDTLLEMAVLLLALLGSTALHRRQDLAPQSALSAPGPVFTSLVRRLAPIMVLVAMYLLWNGSHGPGGAFQGGAILAGAGVMLVLAEQGGWTGFRRFGRQVLVAGFLLFLTLAAVGPLQGEPLLRYPRSLAPLLLMILETVLTFSIGATLLGLFLANPQGCGPHRERP